MDDTLKAALLAGVILTALVFARRASATPTADDIQFSEKELSDNWGTMPAKYRRLLLVTERLINTPGSARVLAIIAKDASGYNLRSHRTDPVSVALSRQIFKEQRSDRPLLVNPQAVADWGVGGLFGQPAPQVLWSGARELGKRAPLVRLTPEAVYDPRNAAFAAGYRLREVITHAWVVDDKKPIDPSVPFVGWTDANLIGKAKVSAQAVARRARFVLLAKQLGIDVGKLPALEVRPWTMDGGGKSESGVVVDDEAVLWTANVLQAMDLEEAG